MEYVASSGTLVSAALQSAGYYYQSIALDALSTPFAGLYYLIYLFAGACAVTSFVITGKVQNVRWLLLGPVLFSVILSQRTPSEGTEWRYGTKVYDNNVVKTRVKSLIDRPLYEPRVSSLFAKFDAVVSQGMQTIIALLNQARKDSDLKLLVRADLYSMVMNRSITDAGLRDLMHVSLLGECRDMVRTGREMADEKNPPVIRCEHAKQYQRYALKPQIHLSDATARFLAMVKTLHPQMYAAQSAANLTEELAKFTANVSAAGSSCPMPPDSTVIASPVGPSGDAATLAIQAVAADMGSASVLAPRSVADVARENAALAGKQAELDKSFQEIRTKAYSCHEIWNLTYKAIHYEAARTKQIAKAKAADTGLDEAAIIAELSSMTGQAGEDQLVRGISRKLFRGENLNNPSAAFVAEYSKQASGALQYGAPGDDSAFTTERGATEMREDASKSKLLAAAAALPYYQGLFLYFLAVIFPFFALLLLLPNRFQGFLFWFSLWIWLKSWDVGFALAGFIDDALFSIFTSQISDPVAKTGQILNPSFSIAVESLRDIDPSFNLGTYYNIMATVIITIPFVSGKILAGWFQRGSKLIEDGVSELAKASSEGAFRAGGQQNIDSLRHASYEERTRAGLDGIESGTSVTGERNYLNQHTMTSQRNGLLGMSPKDMLDNSVRSAGVASALSRTGTVRPGGPGYAAAGGPLAGEVAKQLANLGEARMNLIVSEIGKNFGNTVQFARGIEMVQNGGQNTNQGEDDSVQIADFDLSLKQIAAAFATGAAASDAAAKVALTPAGKISERSLGSGAALPYGAGAAAGFGVGQYIAQGINRDAGRDGATVGASLPYSSSPLAGTDFLGVETNFGAPILAGGINSSFGASRRGVGGVARSHAGTDMGSSAAPDVVSAAGGRVAYKGTLGGYGNTVIVQHDSKTFTLYAHLQNDSISVENGATVDKQGKIGLIGDTGNAHIDGKDNAHLHFEVIQVEYQPDGKGGQQAVFYQIDPYAPEGSDSRKVVMNESMTTLMTGLLTPK